MLIALNVVQSITVSGWVNRSLQQADSDFGSDKHPSHKYKNQEKIVVGIGAGHRSVFCNDIGKVVN